MKYKVGDKVTLINRNIMTIDQVDDILKWYRMKEDPWNYYTDEMIEGLVEKDVNFDVAVKETIKDISEKVVDTLMGGLMIGKSFNLPQGYQFKDENGNVIQATKIVLEKKTDKYMNENNTKVDMGEVSDGYHTFNELYEYRMLYNAALFNEFAKQGLYDVHKSRKHSDGEYPFGDSNWFIVMAELPTGQISNHYEMKDWNKFQIPEKPLANKWDEHSPRDVADRLTSFTTPKKEYPKTYEECLSVLGIYNRFPDVEIYNAKPSECKLFESLIRLKRCRDAYWKIAGEEMGLGKPWEPDWCDYTTKYCIIYSPQYRGICKRQYDGIKHILAFPTEEMRDAFYENFKEEIEICKELL